MTEAAERAAAMEEEQASSAFDPQSGDGAVTGEEERGALSRGLLLSVLAAGLVLFAALAFFFTGLLRPSESEPTAAISVAMSSPAQPLTSPRQGAERPADASELPTAQASLFDSIETGAPVTEEAFAPAIAAEREEPVQATNGPRIAILLTEVGTSRPAATEAIELLSPAVALAFSPYPEGIGSIADQARAQGHEVWLGIPMQPTRYPSISPGKNTLLVNASPEENLKRLDWALGRLNSFSGVYNMMGSAFTADSEALRPVLDRLAARNIAFIDSRSSGRSIAAREAQQLGIASAVNNRFLDENPSTAAIEKELKALEAVAKKQGHAIGFARALPGSIKAIAEWEATLSEKEIRLVPPSELLESSSES